MTINNTPMLLVLFLAASVFWNSCKTTKTATVSTEESGDEILAQNDTWPSDSTVFFKIRRSPCMGKCPVYEAIIYDNGTVRYDGWQFTDRQGRHRAEGGKKIIDAVRSLCDAIGFMQLGDEYPSTDMRIMDMTTTVLTLRDNGMEKTIQNHNYANPDTPGETETVQSLMQFANQIDSLMNDLDWTLTDEKQIRQ